MSRPRIEIPHRELVEICRRHHIQQLSLFGSVLRGDFTERSDVDYDLLWETTQEDLPPLIENLRSALEDRTREDPPSTP